LSDEIFLVHFLVVVLHHVVVAIGSFGDGFLVCERKEYEVSSARRIDWERVVELTVVLVLVLRDLGADSHQHLETDLQRRQLLLDSLQRPLGVGLVVTLGILELSSDGSGVGLEERKNASRGEEVCSSSRIEGSGNNCTLTRSAESLETSSET